MTKKKKSLGLKQLDFHADIMNMADEPIIRIDSIAEDEYFRKKLTEALEDLPKPKTGYLLMTPDVCKLESMDRFLKNDETSFKCERRHDYGFRKPDWLKDE